MPTAPENAIPMVRKPTIGYCPRRRTSDMVAFQSSIKAVISKDFMTDPSKQLSGLIVIWLAFCHARFSYVKCIVRCHFSGLDLVSKN